jgi:hypothetical protein
MCVWDFIGLCSLPLNVGLFNVSDPHGEVDEKMNGCNCARRQLDELHHRHQIGVLPSLLNRLVVAMLFCTSVVPPVAMLTLPRPTR